MIVSIDAKNMTEADFIEHNKVWLNPHISLDSGDLPNELVPYSEAISGNNKGITVGHAANRNRSLRYFASTPCYDSILILDAKVKFLRPGIEDQLKLAIEEVKQPFMSICNTGLPIKAAGEWVVYHEDVNAAGIYITREAFDKVGFFNNTPKYHNLYLQRLMRAYGFSPQFLPTLRYSSYFLDTPEYASVSDPRYQKFADEIWKGNGLYEGNPGLPKKGEYGHH